MNNIEIKNIPGLKSGMSDTQINRLKSQKLKVKKIKFKTGNKTKKEVKQIVKNLKDKMKKFKIPSNFSYKLDLIKDEQDYRDFKLTEETFNLQGTTLSKSVDWTDKMSPVKDQGRLGSCVSFASVAVKEFQEQQEHLNEVKSGKKYKKKNWDFSEQWLYYKCKEIDGYSGEGTYIRCAMKVLNKIGVPCEKGWEYNDKIKGKPESWARMVSTWNIIDSYYRVRGIDDLRLALENGPVVGGILCFREIFFVGEDGMISYPSNPDEIFGGHAIAIVGFDDEKQLIKFKNSWSENWGKNGYGYISYKYVNNFMLDCWAMKDLSVTKEIFNENVNNELI